MQHLLRGQSPVLAALLLFGAVCPLMGVAAAWLCARLAGASHRREPQGSRLPAGGRASAGFNLVMVAAGLVLTACSLAARPSELGWSLGLGWTLLVLAAVDLAAFRLPDVLTLPLMAAGLLRAWLSGDDLPGHVMGLVVGYAAIAATGRAFLRLRGRRGIGLGDAKLFAAGGAWLGWAALPAVMLIACAVGLAWFAVAALRKGRAALRAPIPFGVPLCCGIWAVWLMA